MKLKEREIADLHEMALVQWERHPGMVRLIHLLYGFHVLLLCQLIRRGPKVHPQ